MLRTRLRDGPACSEPDLQNTARTMPSTAIGLRQAGTALSTWCMPRDLMPRLPPKARAALCDMTYPTMGFE